MKNIALIIRDSDFNEDEKHLIDIFDVKVNKLLYLNESCIINSTITVFNAAYSQSLSGFLKRPSCCTALLKINEDWTEALDDRQTVIAVSIDLTKAFDSICHLLLRKLEAYGILGCPLN